MDYAREMAFVAVTKGTGAFSEWIADPDYVRAEYAILVTSDLKGLGLGSILMRHLIDYARAEKLS